jgi:hypothetical protein
LGRNKNKLNPRDGAPIFPRDLQAQRPVGNTDTGGRKTKVFGNTDLKCFFGDLWPNGDLFFKVAKFGCFLVKKTFKFAKCYIIFWSVATNIKEARKIYFQFG